MVCLCVIASDDFPVESEWNSDILIDLDIDWLNRIRRIDNDYWFLYVLFPSHSEENMYRKSDLWNIISFFLCDMAMAIWIANLSLHGLDG